MASASKQLPLWIDAPWLGLLALYILAGAAAVPFHGDESTQIYMGRDYYYQFAGKAAGSIGEAGSLAEQELRLLNGTVSKTIYGWIAASSDIPLDKLNEQWDWEADYSYNRDTNRIPDSDLLYKGRLASAGQLVLAALAFFCFVKMTIHRPVAWLASGLFVFHPTILLNGRRAMMEGSHLLGMMLVLLAAAWVMRGGKWRAYAALGAAAGFAMATKHPNVIAVGMVFFAGFSLALFRAVRDWDGQRRRFVKAVIGLSAAGLLALLVFYALNPAWWQSPLASARQVLPLRTGLLANQMQTYGGYGSLGERADGFFRYVFAGKVQYFEAANWAGYDVIRDQIQAYQASGLAGAAIGGSSLVGLLFLLLTLSGGVYLFGSADIPAAYRWLLMVWGAGTAALIFLFTPLPWGRYYLPLIPFVTIMAAYSLWALAAPIRKRIKASGYGFAVLD